MNKIQAVGTTICLSASLLLTGCQSDTTRDSQAKCDPQLIDQQATQQTRQLWCQLHSLKGQHMLFGHQDTLAYGVNWIDETDRSDIKDVTGSHAALYGWELGGLAIGQDVNLDKVPFAKMQAWMKEIHQRGGVNTVSWHMYDPVTGNNSWAKVPSVPHLLPGGSHHEQFKQYLDTFVEFNNGLYITDSNGNSVQVPLIFRPWHEHTGEWFWWGKGHTEEQDYKALWRFTVEYLLENNVHNLIYAYSPDRGRIDLSEYEQQYFYGYPGDDYVDVFGIDAYRDMGADGSAEMLAETMAKTAKLASQRNKLAAVSEGGWDGIGDANYWTQRILKAYLANQDTRQIAYLMVWRNANKQKENRDHFYGPFVGHPSEQDFRDFVADPHIWLQRDLSSSN